MDIQNVLRRAPKQDKKNKNRKYGRNGRTAKHKVGQTCSMKNCYKLQQSRFFNKELNCYMAFYPNWQRERLQNP